MDALTVHIEGIGWWSRGVEDWERAAAILRAHGTWPAEGPPPEAAVLPPTERRRAPESVRLACAVAAQACAMAGRDAQQLPCVFASTWGDLAITHELCTTLASEPGALSPTRFHNSVHNAPVGYWTIATGCRESSSAVSAWHGSFGAGLFEAAVEASADGLPVLFAAYDGSVSGPLAELQHPSAPFGAAFVLNPARDGRRRATLSLRHDPRPLGDEGAEPFAGALPLFAALARGTAADIVLAAGAAASLVIQVQP
jgi:beta-ketoacyl synthase-like protein